MEFDVITVQIVPEKKGLFLKHSEYEITSKRQQSTICRRYNDFVSLHGLLVTRSPYRMIPRLPPKQIMLNSLLEERRKGLQRWLRIVSRHPIIGADPLFVAFLRDTSTELVEHMLNLNLNEPDEFEKLSVDFVLPLEDQGRLAASRESMRTMLISVTKLKRLADQQTQRTQSQARDIEEMGSILHLFSSSQSDSTYGELAVGFKEAAVISDRCALHLQNSISERFALLIEVLTAHSDLCDRVERGIVSDHQKAMSKMLTLNKQRMKGVMRGTDAENVAAIHKKEVVQNGVLGTLERRSAFSLHCVLQETELAQEALRSLPSIMLSFTHEQNQGNLNISKVWNTIITTESNKLSQ